MLLAALACTTNGSKSTRAREPGAAPNGVARSWVANSVQVVSQPSAAGNTVLLTARRRQGFASFALDARTGAIEWQRAATVHGRVSGMTVPAPTAVAFGSHWLAVTHDPARKAGAESRLVARDSRTGQSRWQRSVNGTIGPQVCGKWVCWDDQAEDSTVAWITASPRTGKTVWHREFARPVDLMYADDNVEVLLELGAHPELVGYATASGAERWSVPLDNQLGRGVNTDSGWDAYFDGRTLAVFIGPNFDKATQKTPDPFGYVAVDPASGAVVWRRPRVTPPFEVTTNIDDMTNRGVPASRPLLVEDVSFQGSGRQGLQLSALERLDPASGRTLWRRAVSLKYRQESPTAALVSDDAQSFFLVDPRTSAAKGFKLDTGEPAPPGNGWLLDRMPDVKVNGNHDSPFAGATALAHVAVSSGDDVAGGVPPPTLATRADNTLVWIDASDRRLHAFVG